MYVWIYMCIYTHTHPHTHTHTYIYIHTLLHCSWPCCRMLGLWLEDAVIFCPTQSDFCPTRIEEALKTWAWVLWVNKGKEISVMLASALLTHKSVTTTLLLVIPPIVLGSGLPMGKPLTWSKHKRTLWKYVVSCDTDSLLYKIMWKRPLIFILH